MVSRSPPVVVAMIKNVTLPQLPQLMTMAVLDQKMQSNS